jgi:zinc transport system substrate-binding protein
MSGEEEVEEAELTVVASFYPLGYMAGEIGGPDVEVIVLVPENSEVHGWQPSPSDIVAADNADVLVYNGAGLDEWFEDDVLDTIDVGDAIVVETTRGLELIDADGHDHDGDGGDAHEGADPHTWLSPWMAMQQGQAIFDALVEADPARELEYDERWLALRGELLSLDGLYLTRLNGTAHDKVIVSHEAYGYLAHRYGFEQHGVIGLSAEEQPSAATIAGIVEEMVELGIYTVYVDPVYSDEYARTLETEVEEETSEDVDVLELYLMTGEVDGLDMLEQMERNLENLATGLGEG